MYIIEGLTPKIGSKGKYFLKVPWECDPNIIYTCERISSILDFKTSKKIDVLKTFYTDNGLTEDDYNYAIKNNIKIVTLNSGSGDYIEVPDNYIEKLPDQGYVPYQQKIISVNLGLLPEDLNIDNTLEKIKAIVSETLNVTVEPKIHVYEAKRFVDWEQYTEMERVRKSGIKYQLTEWQIIRKLEIENDALSAAVLELESALTENAS